MAKLDDLKKQKQAMEEAAAAAHQFGKGVEKGQERAEKVAQIFEEIQKVEKSITQEKQKQAKLQSTSASNLRKIQQLSDNVKKNEQAREKSLVSSLAALAKGDVFELLRQKRTEKVNLAQVDLSKSVSDQAKILKGMPIPVEDMSKVLSIQSGIVDGSIKEKDLDEQMLQLAQSDKGLRDEIQGVLQDTVESKNAEKKVTEEIEESEERRNQLQSKANILAGVGLGIFAALAKLASSFAQRIDEVGKTFGDLTNVGPNLVQDLTAAGVEAQKLGLNQADVLATVTTLSSEFGVSLSEATKLSNAVLDTATATGLSADEGAKLFGVLMQTADLSANQAEKLAEGAAQLARQRGVAPQAVLRDIAASAETIAEFTTDGAENIAEAAVQARILGVSLDTTAKISKGLLDFQNSISSEIEASVMIGKQLNFQRARQLALEGDIAGATKEVVAQLGSEAEFNKLNVLQRESLAKSIGVSVSELSKLVGQTDKLTVSGALAAGSFDDLAGQKALSNLSSITNEVKSLFSEALVLIGPEIENLVGGFRDFLKEKGGVEALKGAFLGVVGAVKATVQFMPALIGLLVSLKVASTAAAIAMAAKAIGKSAFKGGAIAAGLTAAGIIASTLLVKNSLSVDDFKSGPGGITHMSGPAGSFKLNPKDSVLATTNPIQVNDFQTGPAGSMGGDNGLAEAIDRNTRALSNMQLTAGRGEIRVAMEPQMGGNL